MIEIFDVKGNLVKTIHPDSNVTTLSALELANGVYHYSISGKGPKVSGSFQYNIEYALCSEIGQLKN